MCEYWWFKSSLWLCVTTCLWKLFHGFVTSQCMDRSRYRFSVYILAFVFHLYKNINSSRTMSYILVQWSLGMPLKIKLLCRTMLLSACAGTVSRLVAILHFSSLMKVLLFLRHMLPKVSLYFRILIQLSNCFGVFMKCAIQLSFSLVVT